MATDTPPQSWFSRNAHIIVWVAVLLVAALGLSWSYIAPPRPATAPQTVQTSAPARPGPPAQPAGPSAAQRAAEEKAAADRAADESAWAQATGTNTASGFESYIQSNPSGAHVAEARERIAALAEQARQAAEAKAAADRAAVERAAAEKAAADQKANDERAWAQATGTNTASGFESYIQSNPSGAHVAEARERIAALAEQARQAAEAKAAAEQAAAEKAAAEQKAAADRAAAEQDAARRAEDEKAWSAAAQTNAVAGYETYLRTYPAGSHAAEAQQRIAALNEQAARAAEERAAAERAAAAKAADERAWVEAAQAGTVAALENYIRNHPSGARAADARDRIAVINEQARRQAEERAAAERAAAAERLAAERAAAEKEAAEKAAAEKAAAEKVAAERAADDRAFADAARIGTIEAYEDYIRQQAAGAHVMEASQRLAQLRAAAQAKPQRAASAPQSAAPQAARDRLIPYVPQKPVFKAPPMSSAVMR